MLSVIPSCIICGAESGHCGAHFLYHWNPGVSLALRGTWSSAKIHSFSPPHLKFLDPRHWRSRQGYLSAKGNHIHTLITKIYHELLITILFMISQQYIPRNLKRSHIFRSQYRSCASIHDDVSYLRYLNITAIITSILLSLLENHTFLLAMIFEIILFTITDVLQLILIFLRRIQYILNRGNFDNLSNMIINSNEWNRSDIIQTLRTWIDVLHAYLSDECNVAARYHVMSHATAMTKSWPQLVGVGRSW
jgi:hypothetical protein